MGEIVEEKATDINVRIPNIFDYATKELSQDAFICWLIQMADCKGHELQTASKEFIALLCQIGGEDKQVSASDVGVVKKMSQQVEGKIDVFFMAVIKGKDTCFIIEDKVDSHPHSDQLQRYTGHIRKKYVGYPIVRIYYKTGYLFENDIKACEQAEYGIFDYKLIYNFLERVETHDVIFKTEAGGKINAGTTDISYTNVIDGTGFPEIPQTEADEHYEFVGWYDEADNAVTTFPTTVDKDYTFIANRNTIMKDAITPNNCIVANIKLCNRFKFQHIRTRVFIHEYIVVIYND